MNENDVLDNKVFIGRGEELKDAIHTLRNTDDGVVWDVVGTHGIGKSELLDRVCLNAVGLGAEVAMFTADLPESRFAEGYRDDHGPKATGLALLAASQNLMLDMASHFKRGLSVTDFDMFKNVCEGQKQQVKTFESQPASSPGAVRRKLRDFQETMDLAFVDAWDNFTRRRHVLVTLDTFDGTAANEFGRWIVGMALRLPKTLTLIARVPSTVKLAPGHGRINQLQLSSFTIAEVNQSLSRRVKVDGFRPGVAEAVHLYTDGHPGGVALVAELIKEKGVDIEVQALRRVLDRLPDDPAGKWAGLVRTIVDTVPDPLLRKVVSAASIVLSFDEPMLAHLLQTQGDVEYSAGDALRALEAYRLIQPVPDMVCQPARHRLHEFIRLPLDEQLRVKENERWEALHRGAAEYCYRLLANDEAVETGETYAGWYRYETPRWQAYKRQWLYHSGRLPDRRERARAEFVLVFLEAFFWFGCYYPFEFNRRLLDDWERATAAWAASAGERPVHDQQLVDALAFLLDNYPLGHVKTSDAPWDEMRSGLLLVRDLCGLSPDKRLPKDPEDRRNMARARAMINIFLAHTCRFSDPNDPEADRYYAQAQGAFENLKDDEWVVAWLLLETADLAMERGRAEDAISLVASAAASHLAEALPAKDGQDGTIDDGLDMEESKADGDWDYELLANLHRIRADVYWMRGELAEAARQYGCAVSSAYWFQGIPQPPDEYTQRFYEEMTQRSAERIIALAEQDEGKAVHFAGNLCMVIPTSAEKSALTEAVRSRCVSKVVSTLFIPGPENTELRLKDSPFHAAWRKRREEHLRDSRSTPAALLADLIGDEMPQ